MQTMVIFQLIFFVLSAQSLVSQSNSEANKIMGTYWSPDKDGRIAMYEKNGKYFGKSIWGTKPGKDVKNPDPRLRQREVIGMEFLTNFEYNPKTNEYQNGKIYDPRSGKTYDCKMWLGKDGNLRVRGYLGFSMLGMTVVFERIDHKKYDPDYQP
jgi:uncharacterized protein (DUF2147 family)